MVLGPRGAGVHRAGMGSKHVRTIRDFMRFRYDVEVRCYCGHRACLPFLPVVKLFSAKGWPVDLGSAARRFRCSKCGSSPRDIGPLQR